MALDWWLLTTVIIGSLLTLGLGGYFVFIFTVPQELKKVYFPKLIATFGFALALMTVLLLPVDVANRKDPTAVASKTGGGLDTVLMWQICLWTLIGMVIVVIPFATFFYEAHDPDNYSCVQQFVPALLYTFALLIVYMILVVVLYLAIGFAEIPYYNYSTIPQFRDPFDTALIYGFAKTVLILEIRVSLFVYSVGLLVAIGWVFFVFYGGVGLVALPVALMRSVRTMPTKPLTEPEYHRECDIVANKALTMIKQAKQLQMQTRDKPTQRLAMRVNAFNAEVTELQHTFDNLQNAFENRDTIRIKFAAICALAVICGCISVAWVLHIFIHNAVQLNSFLTVVLVVLDNAFPLLGTLAYGVLAFYLLWCSIVGCIAIGRRVPIFSTHPMRIKDTRINSILFNAGLVLLTALTVTQFCAMSFIEYVANTAIDMLVNMYVRRLKGFGVITIYFQFAFVGIAVLSTAWVICCPAPPVKEGDSDDDD